MTQLPLFAAPQFTTEYANDVPVVLHTGDTLTFSRTLPTESVDLIVTSPPYNIGKAYETRRNLQQYLQEQAQVLDELNRILHSSGSICWQVGNYVEDGEIFPLDIYFYSLFKERGFKLRNRIIWHFGHGLHASKRFSGRYETVLWFTKSDDYVFNLDSVRVPSKYPGKRHFKGEKKGQLSGNPLGKNPSDLWEFVVQEWDKELWDIPNVKANHPEKTNHPCQFPIELVERCVLAFTNEGQVIYDPYCGVGSSLIAGLRHQRRVVGCDNEPDYTALAHQRIMDFYAGKLKVRPLTRPVHQPTGREKIARIPDEWKDS